MRKERETKKKLFSHSAKSNQKFNVNDYNNQQDLMSAQKKRLFIRQANNRNQIILYSPETLINFMELLK